MNKKPIQRALIVGATSGIGKETALQLLQKGWILGLAGRREENLKELQQLAPERIHIQAIDICQEDATDRLLELIEEMGGMDLYLHCSGIGHQNYQLAPEIELRTLETNGTGFVRMVTAAFRYFAQQKGGHLAVISSIAGTKGWELLRPILPPNVSRTRTSMRWSNWLTSRNFPSGLQTSVRDSWPPDS